MHLARPAPHVLAPAPQIVGVKSTADPFGTIPLLTTSYGVLGEFSATYTFDAQYNATLTKHVVMPFQILALWLDWDELQSLIYVHLRVKVALLGDPTSYILGTATLGNRSFSPPEVGPGYANCANNTTWSISGTMPGSDTWTGLVLTVETEQYGIGPFTTRLYSAVPIIYMLPHDVPTISGTTS